MTQDSAKVTSQVRGQLWTSTYRDRRRDQLKGQIGVQVIHDYRVQHAVQRRCLTLEALEVLNTKYEARQRHQGWRMGHVECEEKQTR